MERILMSWIKSAWVLAGATSLLITTYVDNSSAASSQPNGVQAAGSITLRTFTPGQKAAADSKARYNWSHDVGVIAYLFGVPLLDFDDWRLQNLSRLNQIRHWRNVATPGFGGGQPSTDTIYSESFLELESGPLIFVVPDTHGRFYSVQFADAYLENAGYILRTKFPHGGRFLIAGPDWHAPTPTGMSLIRLPTNEAYALIRIYAADATEYPQVHALQDQFALNPLDPGKNVFPSTNTYAPAEESEALSQFQRMLTLMHNNPPDAKFSPLMTLFRQVGLNPDKPFRQEALDPATANGLASAIPEAQDILRWEMSKRSDVNVNGWDISSKGLYEDDFLERAVIAIRGFVANDPRGAVYFSTYTDTEGHPLQGKTKYRVRIPAGLMGQCHAFWSITFYDATFNLLANPINKYSVWSADREAHKNVDGSIDIYVQYARPSQGVANWIPAPKLGPFHLGLRCYEPSAAMLDKSKLSGLLPTIVASASP